MKEAVGVFVGLVLVAIALGAIVAFPVMLLWNGCLVSAIDGVKEISYLQAWGLYILSNLIFKTSVSRKD